MTIKAVLFDKDGTLIDFDVTWGNATYEVFHELVEGDAEKMQQLADVTLYDLQARKISQKSPLVGDSPLELAALWADIAGKTPGPDFEDEINRKFTTESANNVAGFVETEPCLRALKEAGHHIGIATNDSEETAHVHMKQLGWHAYFDVIFGYDSGHGPKPGSGMVEAFMKQFSLSPHETVMIGDSLHDIRSGRAAGARTIGVATGPWGGHKLEMEADAVIGSLAELPDALIRLSG